MAIKVKVVDRHAPNGRGAGTRGKKAKTTPEGEFNVLHPTEGTARSGGRKASSRVSPVVAGKDVKGQPSSDDVAAMLEEEGLPTLKKHVPGARATDEERDYRLRQILRLVLRGVARKTIAEHLGIGMAQLKKDITHLNSELKTEVQNLDYPLYVGMTLSFFDEVRNIALRTATDVKEKNNIVKMRALDTALKAEVEKHKYLQLTGMYKIATPGSAFGTFGTQESGDDSSDIRAFISAVMQPDRTVEGVVREMRESEEEIIHGTTLMDKDT